MKLQQARRTNPYPWTWEIPAAAIVAALLTMVLALHPARAIATLFAGHGLQFTPRPALFSSIPGLVTGDAAAGLTTSSTDVTSGQLWFWIMATELVVLVIIGLMVRSAVRQWGPGRIQGMASRGESEQLLGISRLRRNAPVIRPDLYGKSRPS